MKDSGRLSACLIDQWPRSIPNSSPRSSENGIPRAGFSLKRATAIGMARPLALMMIAGLGVIEVLCR